MLASPMVSTIQDNAMLWLPLKFGGWALNTYLVIMLTSSSDTNYVINKHEMFRSIWLICNPIQDVMV